jgi:tripartite motif-containing protein 37
VIRRAFAATFFQRRRRRSSRAAGHVANEQVLFAQAAAAGAGTNIASPTLAVRKASSHIPSMKQLQMKMQEYNGTTRAGKWLPGTWPQAEDYHHSECTIEHLELSQAPAAGESVENLEARLDQPSPTVAQQDHNLPNEDPFADLAPNDEDDDAGAPSVELIDMRRKTRFQEGLQTPKGRAHKKLRSRKVHKLTLLAPESLIPFTDPPGTTGLAQHLAGLSIVEVGPSAGAKNLAGSAANECESSESANVDESSRDQKCEDGFSDAEGRSSEPPVVTILETNTVEGVEENEYPYYRSMSGSSTSFCTPEIEDWGNLK